MFRKYRFFKLLSLMLVLIMLLSTPVFAYGLSDATPDEATERFEMVLELYLKNHYMAQSRTKVLEATLQKLLENHPELLEVVFNSLLTSQDPYGYYISAQTKAMIEDAQTASGGIGVNVEEIDGYVTVRMVYFDSPAHRAGLLPGDRFVEVDGIDVRNWPLSQLSPLVRGEIGTSVKIGILRGDEAEVRYFTVVRQELIESAVSSMKVDDSGIYLVSVSDFTRQGVDEFFYITVSDILSQEDYKGLIIDMRNNRGGSFQACLNMINTLIPFANKTICSTVEAKGPRETIYSTGEMLDTKKCAILVNESSASAAELFSISLQQNGIAKIIGKTTYGKAIGQTGFDLYDNATVNITTFEVLSPRGSRYNEIGVTPDYDVDNEAVPIQLPAFSPLNNKNYLSAAKGSVNDVVLALEQRLSYLGYILNADDYFDAYTEKALSLFQQDLDIEPTGKMDWATLAALTSVFNEIKTYSQVKDVQLETAVSYIKGELK